MGSRRGPCAAGSAALPDTSLQAGRLMSLRGTNSEPGPSPELRKGHGRRPERHGHLAPAHPSLTPSPRARTVPARQEDAAAQQDPSLQPAAFFSLSLCTSPSPQYTIVCPGPEQGRGPARAGCCLWANFCAHQPLEAAPELQPPWGTAAKPFPESKGGENRCQPHFPLSDPGKPRGRQQLSYSGC